MYAERLEVRRPSVTDTPCLMLRVAKLYWKSVLEAVPRN